MTTSKFPRRNLISQECSLNISLMTQPSLMNLLVMIHQNVDLIILDKNEKYNYL